GAASMKLNSLGYRGPELHAGRARVVCFGASETFGLYEDAGQEYPRLLEQELNRRFGRDAYDVLNVAYPGESIHTALARVPEIAAEARPQLAVIYPSLASYIWLPWTGRTARTATAAPPQPHFELRIAENVRNLVKQVLPRPLQDWLRRRDIENQSRDFGSAMQRIPEHNVEVFRADLLDLVRALRSNGVSPVLVTHATRFGAKSFDSLSPAEQADIVTWRRFYPMLSEAGFPDME